MIARKRVCSSVSPPASPSRIISRKPIIEVNGVRSSCDTVATKSSFKPVELALLRHLAQRPDPAEEPAAVVANRRGEALEDRAR